VVRDVAARSDALLHIVGMSSAFLADEERDRFQCVQLGLCQPTRRFWQPFRRASFQQDGLSLTASGQALADGARATGGAFHLAQFLNEPTLASTFRRVFDDFRSRYVLRYTPQGVKRDGWHAITVRVPGSPDAVVEAKRGYAVEPAVTAPNPRRGSDRAPTLTDLVDAYTKADYLVMRQQLARLEDVAGVIGELRESGNPWPATPRREAVFVLELAETGLASPRLADRDAAATLLNSFHRLIRHPLEPDAFERYWLWAELAMAQGMVRSQFAEPLVAYALSRFPEEPRFVLAKAIVTDQAWPTGLAFSTTTLHKPVRPADAHVTNVIARYVDAIAHPETAPEARVRLAWFLYRIGRHQEALRYLDAVADEQGLDGSMRYLYRLFRGHVLEALERPADAIRFYREALAMAPNAQSARVSMMNALLRAGDRRGAEAIAEQVQTAGRDDFDPWWGYIQGEFRLYPGAIGRLREMVR
jgi:tetratricopeptide (TPR) repeat protein